MKQSLRDIAHPDPRMQRILIVDDNADYRASVRMTLDDFGYQILEARDGLEGLESAAEHLPDLILCDINMPNMDGLELLSACKDRPDLSKISFVFLTGRDDKHDFRLGMQLGADDYLTKPFSASELVATVRTQLKKRDLLQKFYALQNEDVKNSLGLFLPHELQTPLNGIIGLSELLKTTPNLSAEEISEYAGLIQNSGRRLRHLLGNFNLFSQIQFWQDDEERIAELRRHVSPSVAEVFHLTMSEKFAAHARHSSLSVRLPVAAVQISRDYLSKLFEELLDNAFKFSPPESPVTVRGSETANEVEITIRDEGRGMTPEQIQKVSAYRQFERQHYEQQGAGLGLAVSRALAELHGGSLTIDSEPGKGMLVTLRLPKARQ
ncbi:MAG TPA: response regulator [Bacteroidota bacterium]|nr:response regulator [Bacteroidota bacterium]